MCMGTTLRFRRFPVSKAVHPHVHGDNGLICEQDQGGLRFTPMCMGTTDPKPETVEPTAVHPHVHGDNFKPSRSARPWTVHPHVHGDNDCPRVTGFGGSGSPPCAWGQRKVADR